MGRTKSNLHDLIRAATGGADRIALIGNVDGTFAELHPDFDQRSVTTETQERLRELQEHMSLFVATGRPALKARTMLEVSDVVIYGHDGLEVLYPDESSPHMRIDYTWPEPELTDFLQEFADDLRRAGIGWDKQGPTRLLYAGHDHNAPARRDLLRQVYLAALLRGFSPQFRTGLLIVGAVDGEKRDIVDELLAGHGIEAAICIGDDNSDMRLWRALERKLPGRMVSIGVHQRHGPRDQIEHEAQHTVEGIGGVNAVLREIRELFSELN